MFSASVRRALAWIGRLRPSNIMKPKTFESSDTTRRSDTVESLSKQLERLDVGSLGKGTRIRCRRLEDLHLNHNRIYHSTQIMLNNRIVGIGPGFSDEHHLPSCTVWPGV